MDVSFGIFLLFIALVVLIPFLLAIITGYETPASFGESLRNNARGAWAGVGATIGFDLGNFGLDFDRWNWTTLLVVPLLIAVPLFIDWMAMRREAKRTTI